MITVQETREVSANSAQSAAFTIKANGKAFKALINGLYARKIESITREIWSNALDAHAAAGHPDLPFEITFPTVWEQRFRVRDFGCSLKHEEVMGLYATVFESTKEDTNAAVGKFGLGSKSPFAYTDSFSVTAIKDGEKRFYAAMLGPDGVPAINFMGSEATAEDDGVEVSFPVDRADISAFALAAKRVALGFDVKPDVTNADHFDGWREFEPALQGDQWMLLSRTPDQMRHGTAYAKQGCVLYPINPDEVDGLDDEERAFLHEPLVIDFSMGALEMTVSREELSYGREEPTTESIRTRVREIVSEMCTGMLEKYASADTLWDAAMQLQDDLRIITLPTAVKKKILKEARWKGQEIPTTFDIHAPFGSGVDIAHLSRRDLGKKSPRFHGRDRFSVSPQGNVIIVVEDRSTKAPTYPSLRMRQLAEETGATAAIWVRADRGSDATWAVRFFDLFDGVPAYDLAEVELPKSAPVSARRNGPRRPVAARILEGREDFSQRYEMDDAAFEKGGVYVPLEGMKPVAPEGGPSLFCVVDVLRRAGRLPRVIGAPKSMWGRFSGAQWVTLWNYARNLFDAEFDADTLNRGRTAGWAEDVSIIRLLRRRVNIIKLPQTSPARIAAEQVDALDGARLNLTLQESLHELGALLGEDVKIPPCPIRTALEAFKDGWEDYYPMLAYVIRAGSYGFLEDDVDILTGYVIMSDIKRTQNHTAQAA